MSEIDELCYFVIYYLYLFINYRYVYGGIVYQIVGRYSFLLCYVRGFGRERIVVRTLSLCVIWFRKRRTGFDSWSIQKK